MVEHEQRGYDKSKVEPINQMEDPVIVFYGETPLMLFPAMAKRLNLTHGQEIETKEEFTRIAHENATHYSLVAQSQLRNHN